VILSGKGKKIARSEEDAEEEGGEDHDEDWDEN
jgi:hypothetical protein